MNSETRLGLVKLYAESTMALIMYEQSKHSGIDYSAWTFEFDNSRVRIGACDYANKKIILSKNFVGSMPFSDIDGAIRHEIAHALTPGEKHGDVWQRVAESIGAKAEVCSDVPIEHMPPSRYLYASYDGDSITIYDSLKGPNRKLKGMEKKYLRSAPQTFGNLYLIRRSDYESGNIGPDRLVR